MPRNANHDPAYPASSDPLAGSSSFEPFGPNATTDHNTTHSNPSDPTSTNRSRQPVPSSPINARARNGVATAPMDAPEWKTPLARPRDSRGTTRRTAATAHGQLNASPSPSITRQAMSSATAPAGTNPVSTPATDQSVIAPR